MCSSLISFYTFTDTLARTRNQLGMWQKLYIIYYILALRNARGYLSPTSIAYTGFLHIIISQRFPYKISVTEHIVVCTSISVSLTGNTPTVGDIRRTPRRCSATTEYDDVLSSIIFLILSIGTLPHLFASVLVTLF